MAEVMESLARLQLVQVPQQAQAEALLQVAQRLLTFQTVLTDQVAPLVLGLVRMVFPVALQEPKRYHLH